MFKKFKEMLEEEDLFDIAMFILIVILAIFVLALTVIIIVIAIKGSDYNIHHSFETIPGLTGGIIWR